MTVSIDARDFARLGRLIGSLPADIQRQAIASATRRVGEMARTAVVRRIAADSGMRVGDVRAVTRMFASGDTATIAMKSGWWPLSKLGAARQTRSGVTVRNWGAHRGAFVGKGQVFRRISAARLPISMLWGPNPVAEVHQEPESYEAILAEVVATHLTPRVLHEVDRLLSRMT